MVESFFDKLNPYEKNSIHQSMKSNVKSFGTLHFCEKTFTTKELFSLEKEIIDEIYFLWFQSSAYREYRWTKRFSRLYFTWAFSVEMKRILKFHLYHYVKSVEHSKDTPEERFK